MSSVTSSLPAARRHGPARHGEDPWLALLLAGGGVAEVSELRDELLAGAADGDGAGVRVAAEQAMRVAAALDERSQRAAELATLYDLAVRLTAVRDLDDLLQEIVTQGRRLLAVDLVYLALREDDGTMHIRVTEGSMGPHMRGTRLSLAGGLAGRVAATGEPFWTSDYPNEAGIEHLPQVDAVATAEQLQSILGVPLRRGAEVLGVLMAAERDQRPFRAGEVSLLSSLAAHAAVAIENARLFSELDSTNRQLRDAAVATQRAVGHHDQLMAVASRGGDVAEVVAGVATFVDGTVSFDEGPEGVPTATRSVTADGQTTTVVPVTTGPVELGTLRVVSPHPPGEIDLRLLERSALTIAMLLSTRRAVSEAEWRTADEALAAVLTAEGADPDVLLRRTAAAGLDLNRGGTVAVLPAAAAAFGATLLQAKEFASREGGLAGRHAGAVVLVTRRPPEVVAAWAATIRPQVTCGLVAAAAGHAGVRAAYREAERTARALEALGRTGEVGAPSDLGPYRFLLSAAGRDDALVFVRAQLGPLLAHDAERSTELVPTLHAFLASGRQHTQTARELSVHTNTLYQRLDRITQVIGDDWRLPERAFDLQMALRMHHLTQAHAPD